MEGLTIRQATAADMPRIAELVAGEPGNEAIGIAGSVTAARRLGMGVYSIAPYTRAWEHTVLAEAGSEVIGVLMSGSQVETLGLSPALAWLAVRSLGPLGVLRALPRMRARSRVQITPPSDAYHIGELDVDPRYRNRGIGGALLDYAESVAGGVGRKQMSLTTTTSNPARRLYERHGFHVVETKTDPDYERYTGIEGRVLMVKDLA
jgi:ribosomal protein S18 acetylase RimI-like enzyme